MGRQRVRLAVLLVVSSSALIVGEWKKTPAEPGDNYVRAMVVSGGSLLVGTGGAGIFLTSDNGATWTPVNSGIAPGDTSIRALALSGTTLFAGTIDGVYRSTSNGASWSLDTVGMKVTSNTVQVLAVGGANIFAGTYKSNIYLSTNNGASWTEKVSKMTDTTILALIVKDNYLFAGTEGNGVFRSADSGATWIPLSSGLVNASDSIVRCFAVKGSTLYAGTKGGVHRSPDNGATWIESDSGMVHNSIHSLLVTATMMFAGAYDGKIYRSLDSGVTWTAYNLGITDTTTIIHALAIRDTFLFAGTGNAGSGVWYRPLAEFQATPVRSSLARTEGTVAFERLRSVSRGRVRLRVTMPSAQSASVRVVDARGTVVATLVDETIPAGSRTLEWARGAAASRVLLCQLTTHAMRRTIRVEP